MGFFKNIGSMIKRNVNFHTLVKVAGQGVSMLPGVGGLAGGVIQNLQAAHDAKLEQNEADSQQAIADAAANTNTIASQYASQVVKGLPAAAQKGIANAGADVADATITVWFKRNWKKVVGGAVAFFALIWAVVHFSKGRHHKPTYKRY